MSKQGLTSVTLKVVGQYHVAGKSLVRAWRAGTDRAVGAINERFASVVNARSLPLVNDDAKSSLIEAEQQFAGLVTKTLAVPADRVAAGLERLSQRATDGIERFADTATRFETVFETPALGKLGVYAMPFAHFSLEVANVLAKGAGKLSEQAASNDESVEEEAEAAAPAAKRRRIARKA